MYLLVFKTTLRHVVTRTTATTLHWDCVNTLQQKIQSKSKFHDMYATHVNTIMRIKNTLQSLLLNYLVVTFPLGSPVLIPGFGLWGRYTHIQGELLPLWLTEIFLTCKGRLKLAYLFRCEAESVCTSLTVVSITRGSHFNCSHVNASSIVIYGAVKYSSLSE